MMFNECMAFSGLFQFRQSQPRLNALCLTLFLTTTTCLLGCGGVADPPAQSPPVTPQYGAERAFATHREADVRFPSEGITLVGRLLLPLGPGPFPVVVMVRGSENWVRLGFEPFTDNWLSRRIAVFTYDKRGVGQSGGVCCTLDFPLYARDALAAVAAAKAHPEIHPRRIVLYGFSEGGWVVPVAAASSLEVALTTIASGPAVSVGEDSFYDTLTGIATCTPTGLSNAEIDQRMAQQTPSGFDPRPHLRQMTQPGLWQFCDQDANIPVRQSVPVLQGFQAAEGKDFTIQTFSNCNHNFILNGGMCVTAGPRVDWVTPMFDWLLPRLAAIP